MREPELVSLPAYRTHCLQSATLSNRLAVSIDIPTWCNKHGATTYLKRKARIRLCAQRIYQSNPGRDENMYKTFLSSDVHMIRSSRLHSRSPRLECQVIWSGTLIAQTETPDIFKSWHISHQPPHCRQMFPSAHVGRTERVLVKGLQIPKNFNATKRNETVEVALDDKRGPFFGAPKLMLPQA